MFAKLGNGTVRDLALDTNTVYTHPSTIQCSAASEISSLKSSVSSGKAQIASAITGKGVSTSSTASFSTMASNIRSLSVYPSDHKASIITNFNIAWNDDSVHTYVIPSEYANFPVYVKLNAVNSNSGRLYVDCLYQVTPVFTQIIHNTTYDVSVSYTKSSRTISVSGNVISGFNVLVIA